MTENERSAILNKVEAVRRELAGLQALIPAGSGLGQRFDRNDRSMRKTLSNIAQWALSAKAK